MFKLVVLSVLIAVASAKPHAIVGSIVGEKTIESHGNSIVHASAPLLAPAASVITSPIIAETPIAYASPSAVVHEKTVESHGNSIVHSSSPIFAAVANPSPLLYTSYGGPLAPLVSEKTISSYGHSVLHHGGPAIAHATYIAPTYAYL